MQKKLRITVEGKVYNVLVEDLTTVDHGISTPMAHSVVSAPFTPVAAAVPMVTTTTSVSSLSPTAAVGVGEEISPLGGIIESVAVSVGQEIKIGDRLLVIESMKMKTPIYAQNSGTVQTLTVQSGDTIEAGRVLATIG